MIFVTHDQVEAMTLAQRIVVLNGGRIEQVGTPQEVYHRPANLFVAGFIGSPAMNLLPAKVLSPNAMGVALGLEDGTVVAWSGQSRGLTPGDQVTLGVRPERLSIVPPGAGQVSGEVTLAEDLGDQMILHLTSGNASLRVKQTGGMVTQLGQKLDLSIDMTGANLFDSEGIRLT
jgi:multiple sugar transport system ATP-binding protein